MTLTRAAPRGTDELGGSVSGPYSRRSGRLPCVGGFAFASSIAIAIGFRSSSPLLEQFGLLLQAGNVEAEPPGAVDAHATTVRAGDGHAR